VKPINRSCISAKIVDIFGRHLELCIYFKCKSKAIIFSANLQVRRIDLSLLLT